MTYLYHGNWVYLILGNGLQLSGSSISNDNYWHFVWSYSMTLCLGKNPILAFPDWQLLKNLQKLNNRQKRLIRMSQPFYCSIYPLIYKKFQWNWMLFTKRLHRQFQIHKSRILNLFFFLEMFMRSNNEPCCSARKWFL